jgi:N,N'-diacetyllegionaminate synthase
MDFVSRRYAFAPGDPPLIIGEVGVNHNGDPALARRLIDVAVEAGVDVVKFQAFRTEKEISRFAAKAAYQNETAPAAANQYELCKPLELSESVLRELKDYSTARDMPFLCSAFDFDSLDFLVDGLKLRAVKIASSEVSNYPFLEYIGRKGIAAILSTGASTLVEVGQAIEALRIGGCSEIVLLHCVSSYPAPPAEINLRAMQTLSNAFQLPVGFSDHTEGIDTALAAAALGAVAIEKHFTLDRAMEGPDHRASIEAPELRRLVAGVRTVHLALGDGVKQVAPCELQNRPLIRKSLVANMTLRRGVRLTRDMIEIKRPEGGIAPGDLHKVLGLELRRDWTEGRPTKSADNSPSTGV